MNSKNFLILAGATALAALLALGLSQKQRPASLEGSGQLLFPELMKSINEVNKIEIKTHEAAFTLQRGEQHWGVAEKGGYPAQTDKVRQLLLGLADLRTLEAKTGKAENYAKLGVEEVTEKDAKSVQVTLQAADGKALAALIVGNSQPAKTDPTRSEIYARKPGEAQSWLVLGTVSPGREAAEWMPREILNIEAQRIKQATFSKPGGEALEISKDKAEDANFKLAGLADSEELKAPYELSNLASTLANLSLEDVAPASQIEFKDGPRAVFGTFDGVQVTAESADKDGKTYVRFKAEYLAPPVEEKPVEAAPSTNSEDKAEGESAAKPETAEEKAQKIQAEVAELNKKLADWAYVLPSYKAANFTKTRADLVKPREVPKAEGGAPAPFDDLAHPGTLSPSEIIQNLGK